jgi:hypothetical protein
MNVVNTYHKTIPANTADGFAHIMAVLTVDATGKFACYVGGIKPINYADKDAMHKRDLAAQYVAAHGDKQTFQQTACNYFPDVKQSDYRA